MEKWTSEEDKILIENYSKYGIWECLKLLNRTKRAITQRRLKLKIDTKHPTKERWLKHNIIEVVETSFTYTECLKKLGINNFGSSTNTLKKYIELYEIDISHFKNTVTDTHIKTMIPLTEILIENSTYRSTTALKNKLYKYGLKNRICEMCGQGEEWNGRRMALILDHINGINNDNRIENLRIVCPNCNGTLPTHCRGNYKIEKKNETEKIKHKEFKCDKFTDNQILDFIKKRKVERPPYQQLINEINELGYCGTGRKYGVSDNTIRKWLKYYKNGHQI